ncbi:MAG: hypothetical protein ACTSUR_04440 [Candidatus Heimdallarchaeaceae archaeon]
MILRKNGDSLQIRMEYFTNSEPFFKDVGHLIPSANVSYLTSWNDTWSLNDNYLLYKEEKNGFIK